MAVVLPGQEFTIEVGGQSIKVKALSGKQQQEEFAPKFQAVIDAETGNHVVDIVTASKDLLDYICGEQQSEELWARSVDASMVIEIATKLLERGRLSEGDLKN